MPDSARNEPFLAESGIRWSRVTPVDLVSSTIHVTAVTFEKKIRENRDLHVHVQLFWSECDTHLSLTLSPQMESKDYPFKSGLGLE